MKKINSKTLLFLHLLLMIYSTSGICSKLAAGEVFLSFKFCAYYGIVIFLMGVYAIGWQQIIKRIPLTAAFANKAVTVVWGLVWGLLFFNETITFGKIVGASLIVIGIVIFATADEGEKNVE